MVESNRVVHIIFRRKIVKSLKLTHTAETYAYESYVHGTVIASFTKRGIVLQL